MAERLPRKTIKVLHCIHSIYGGGAEKQLRILSVGGSDVDLESAVYCHDNRVEELSSSGVEIFVNKKSHFDLISSYMAVNSAIKASKPDVVHVWLPPAVTVPAMLACFVNKKPCVASYRNKMFFGSVKNYVEYLFALMFSVTVISNNPVSQSSYFFRKLFNFKKGKEIPNAVSVNDRVRWKPSCDDEFRFLFVGRLTKQKNLGYLITALSNISTVKKWTLTVCGEGEDRSDLIGLTNRLGLNEVVDFIGYCDNIHEVMIQHHMLVLPSRYEGMPNVAVEAMVLGLPCALSDIESHRWVVCGSDHALFFNLDKIDSLEKILVSSVDSHFDLDCMSSKGVEFTKKYSVGALLDNYRQAYEEIC